MIIFMGGVPCSGKSEFLKFFIPKLNSKPTLLDPKSLLPKDFESNKEDEKTKLNIACWEVCLEELDKLIRNPDSFVILDTTSSKASYMRQYFTKAKLNGHEVIYLPVLSKKSLVICRNNNNIDGEIIDNYFDNLESSMPILAKQANNVFVIVNNKTKMELKNRASNIAKIINKRILK